MKKELFVFVLISFFITLISLGAQIRGAQTRYTVVNFGLYQPLPPEYTSNKKDLSDGCQLWTYTRHFTVPHILGLIGKTKNCALTTFIKVQHKRF